MKEILPKNLVKNTYYYIYCRWIDNCQYIKSKLLYPVIKYKKKRINNMKTIFIIM